MLCLSVYHCFLFTSDPPFTLHPQAAVMWKREVQSCQNSGVSLSLKQKQQPPCVDRVGPLASPCSASQLLRWADPGQRGNTVICSPWMYAYIRFYDPIHAQIATGGWGGVAA